MHLAREFGFCYGVDRAVDYAYQTRRRFPDRAVYLTGEIIHNPHVNDQLRAMGVRFLSDTTGAIDTLGADDVVILPAFGVTMADAAAARTSRLHADRHDLRLGAERLEERPALRRERLHGGHSRQGVARGNPGDGVAGGRVRRPLPRRLRRRRGRGRLRLHPDGRRSAPPSSRASRNAVSPGFDPDRDLQRIGLANQTTMLMSESLEIEQMLKAAMLDRYGDVDLGEPFPGVRHHLQRHPGSPGRRRRTAARRSRSI